MVACYSSSTKLIQGPSQNSVYHTFSPSFFPIINRIYFLIIFCTLDEVLSILQCIFWELYLRASAIYLKYLNFFKIFKVHFRYNFAWSNNSIPHNTPAFVLVKQISKLLPTRSNTDSTSLLNSSYISLILHISPFPSPLKLYMASFFISPRCQAPCHQSFPLCCTPPHPTYPRVCSHVRPSAPFF